MKDLVDVILKYESDTFSASGLDITEAESIVMAYTILSMVTSLVSESGTAKFDGTVLTTIIETIRGNKEVDTNG